jgi:hypothetical protein
MNKVFSMLVLILIQNISFIMLHAQSVDRIQKVKFLIINDTSNFQIDTVRLVTNDIKGTDSVAATFTSKGTIHDGKKNEIRKFISDYNTKPDSGLNWLKNKLQKIGIRLITDDRAVNRGIKTKSNVVFDFKSDSLIISNLPLFINRDTVGFKDSILNVISPTTTKPYNKVLDTALNYEYLFYGLSGLLVITWIFIIITIRRRRTSPIVINGDGSEIKNVLDGDDSNDDSGKLHTKIESLEKQLSSTKLELDNLKIELSRRSEQFQEEKTSLLGKLKERDAELSEKNLEISKCNEQRIALITEQEQSEKNIKRYLEENYYSLYRELSTNSSSMNSDDIHNLVITSLFRMAILTISHFKIQLSDFQQSDINNARYIEGVDTQPIFGHVNELSRKNEVDILAFYIFQILKKNGISKIEGIDLHGYKIGNP